MQTATPNELLAELRGIESRLAAGPWNEGALYMAIRHVQRNTEVLSDALENEEPDAPRGLPDRYDGTDLAKLRNLLPAIIETLAKASA